MLHHVRLTSFGTVFLIVVLLLTFPPTISNSAADDSASSGTFTGEMTGQHRNAGTLTGTLTLSIFGKSVSGNFSGGSSTGDTFGGTISGSFDISNGALDASYSGSFNQILGGKLVGTVPMSGPFNGTLNGSVFSGIWSGKASGSWNATGKIITEAVTETPAEAPSTSKLTWEMLTKSSGLKVSSGRIGDDRTTIMVNASNRLRAITTKGPAGKIKIDLMPNSAIGLPGTLNLPNIPQLDSPLSRALNAPVPEAPEIQIIWAEIPGRHEKLQEHWRKHPEEREKFDWAVGRLEKALKEYEMKFERQERIKNQVDDLAIGMSKAMVNIKQTEFVLVDTGTTSTVKMLRGSVEFTSTVTDQSITVSAGETCTATNEGIGNIEKFDVAAEKTRWAKAEEEAGLVPEETKSWHSFLPSCTLIRHGARTTK